MQDGSTAMSIAMDAGHRDVGVMLYAHVNFHSPSQTVSRRYPFVNTDMAFSQWDQISHPSPIAEFAAGNLSHRKSAGKIMALQILLAINRP